MTNLDFTVRLMNSLGIMDRAVEAAGDIKIVLGRDGVNYELDDEITPEIETAITEWVDFIRIPIIGMYSWNY